MACMHERLSLEKQRGHLLLSRESRPSPDIWEELNNQQMQSVWFPQPGWRLLSLLWRQKLDSYQVIQDIPQVITCMTLCAWDGHGIHCSEKLGATLCFLENIQNYWLQTPFLFAKMQLSVPQRRRINWSWFYWALSWKMTWTVWTTSCQNRIFGVLKKIISSVKVNSCSTKPGLLQKVLPTGCHKTRTAWAGLQIHRHRSTQAGWVTAIGKLSGQWQHCVVTL